MIGGSKATCADHLYNSPVGVALSCGCGPLLWVWPSHVGAALSCGCGPLMWVRPSLVGVAHSCGCGPLLWVWPSHVGVAPLLQQRVWPSLVGVALSCGCGPLLWVWPLFFSRAPNNGHYLTSANSHSNTSGQGGERPSHSTGARCHFIWRPQFC